MNGGVSQACLGKSTSHRTFTIWSIDSCKNRIDILNSASRILNTAMLIRTISIAVFCLQNITNRKVDFRARTRDP